MILSLETATSVCSIALHEEGRLVASAFNSVEQTASSQLAVMIKSIFEEAQIKPEKLKAVAVSAGPGSYTGLRIGAATAKGLCYGLGIPLISLNTLLIMTQSVAASSNGNALYCPMIDARRMEVYCLITNSQLEILEPTQALVVEDDSFNSWLEKNEIYFFGNGSQKCAELIKHSNAKFLSDITPHAKDMGEMALAKLNAGYVENIFEFEPLYLKDFIAKKPKSTI